MTDHNQDATRLQTRPQAPVAPPEPEDQTRLAVPAATPDDATRLKSRQPQVEPSDATQVYRPAFPTGSGAVDAEDATAIPTQLTSAEAPTDIGTVIPTEATQPPVSFSAATLVNKEILGPHEQVTAIGSTTAASTQATQNTAQVTPQSSTKSTTRTSTQTNPYGYGEGHHIAPKAGARVLRGRFELQEPPLGSGGMGDVFLARDLLRVEMQDPEPYVALKLLNEACRQLPGALQALQREAKKAQTLSHPNIVTVYDFDRDGEDAFITMEYLKGYALKDHLRKFQKLNFAEGQPILEKIARGLAFAHQEGFVHADIKPANIYLSENNSVKILDLGIAQAFTEARKEAPSAADELTKNALTPSYASVEMLAGESTLPADDVYALGCVAYEIFAGKHPFANDKGRATPADKAKALGMQVETIPGIPKRQMNAIKKCLAFSRAERFEDAGAFIDAFKPRNLKKDLLLLGSAVVVTGAIIFAVNLSLKAVVPSIDSLPPPLAEVAKSLRDGDELLAAGDIEMAHRLYAEGWEQSNETTNLDPGELDKAHMILRDRMNAIAEKLIEQSETPNLDEFRLRELSLALGFMLKDEITDKETKIKKALAKIQKKLPKN